MNQDNGHNTTAAFPPGTNPRPWPEQPAPEWVDMHRLCEIVRGRRFVWGEGNPEGRLVIVLDNPGSREDPEGRPWVCGTRRTLMNALDAARIPRDHVYLTFLLKCRPRAKYDRSAAYQAHLPVLKRQLQEYDPAWLVVAGNTVARVLFGPEAEVRLLRGRWHRWLGRTVRVTYHPLAARRRPNLFPLVVDDLSTVAKRMTPVITT